MSDEFLEKFVEYCVNEEDRHGDIIDVDSADTEEEAREKAEKLDRWSIEKVTDYGNDSELLVKRETKLIDESDNL